MSEPRDVVTGVTFDVVACALVVKTEGLPPCACCPPCPPPRVITVEITDGHLADCCRRPGPAPEAP